MLTAEIFDTLANDNPVSEDEARAINVKAIADLLPWFVQQFVNRTVGLPSEWNNDTWGHCGTSCCIGGKTLFNAGYFRHSNGQFYRPASDPRHYEAVLPTVEAQRVLGLPTETFFYRDRQYGLWHAEDEFSIDEECSDYKSAFEVIYLALSYYLEVGLRQQQLDLKQKQAEIDEILTLL